MAVLETKITPGYLMGVQRKVKGAIEVLCKKNDLSIEDTQAIRVLTEVIDHLKYESILAYRKETQRHNLEGCSEHEKD